MRELVIRDKQSSCGVFTLRERKSVLDSQLSWTMLVARPTDETSKIMIANAKTNTVQITLDSAELHKLLIILVECQMETTYPMISADCEPFYEMLSNADDQLKSSANNPALVQLREIAKKVFNVDIDDHPHLLK